MGTIIAFPTATTASRQGSVAAPRAGMGQVVILPVVRIERQVEDTSGGSGPEEGAAPGRRRKRRARS
ncbi:MAG: hypothetical protein JWR73_2812 [Tardiphaga sp.]|jgi:hypothetical protein|nr:hypothetical protein [Tardiphaga sp.]MDB5548976.1 hypothetical protein [Tardiphaga sp.]MDB5572911.1 hypothetical protein [Tardiphaga sp.]MDB5627010.1 hypothetical protein [Tardiphaga sp.]MDB5628030.1 hypothetical protein [Tardiphaga sp.]